MMAFGRAGIHTLAVALLLMGASPESSAQQPDEPTADTSEVGYLVVKAPPRIDSLYVVVDRNFDAPYYVENGDSLALPTGDRYVTLAMKQTRDLSFVATIQAGKIEPANANLIREEDQDLYLAESSYPVLRSGTNLLVITDRDSRIQVDGEPQGTGRARLRVSAGTHRIETVHPEAGRTERIVTVQTDPPRLTRPVMYNKPSWRAVQYRSAVPGLAQLYKENTVKGLSLLAGFVVTSAVATQQSLVFSNQDQEYEEARREYENASTEEEALRLGNKTERLYENARGAYWRRNALLGAAAGIYLYSVFDAWLNQPEGGYRTPLSQRATIEPLLGTRRQGVRLVVQF